MHIMKNKIAILIINYEQPKLVENLVNQIKFFNNNLYDLTIIDNSINDVYKNANIINNKNLGYDQVVSRWLQEKSTENYLGYWLLNSDCILNTDLPPVSIPSGVPWKISPESARRYSPFNVFRKPDNAAAPPTSFFNPKIF